MEQGNDAGVGRPSETAGALGSTGAGSKHFDAGNASFSGQIVSGMEGVVGGWGGTTADGAGAIKYVYIVAGVGAVCLCIPPVLSRAVASLRVGEPELD